MKGILYLTIFQIIILSACSCSNRDGKTRPFPYMSPPAMINSEESAAEYMSDNFWNGFFDTTAIWKSDSATVAGVSKKELNEAFSSYVRLVFPLGQKGMTKANDRMLEQLFAYVRHSGDSSVLPVFADILEAFFYDPNSFLRNDEIIIPAYRSILESGMADENLYASCSWILSRAMLNRVGETASDFVFTDSEGNESSLSSINSEYLLLFFNNPGCNACAIIIDFIKNSMVLEGAAKEKDLTVLALYIDENVEEWMEYAKGLPEKWIKAYDPTFSLKEGIYDLKAIPTIYLLDNEKTVILKDADIRAVEAWFQNR